mmetsp:Transcript_32459/g.62105  ORF Transcript_32459/g.62105 Transcript_32459/m.62105 type:complete len:345 (-) Transcript_32459:78-1112(-)
MVTTYNTRLINLTTRFNPIIVSGNKRKYVESHHSSREQYIAVANHINQNHSHPPPTKMMTSATKKRQHPDNDNSFYAHIENNNESSSTASKRRRQKEELAYAAATVKTALAEAAHLPSSILNNWREHASPIGSDGDDMEGVKVMTSSDFDREEEAEIMAMNGDDNIQQEDQQQQVENETIDERTSQEEDPNGNVSSMYMLAGLIQSTRNYYSFEIAAHDDTATSLMINNTNNDKEDSMAQAYIDYNSNNYNNEKAPSEDNSEDLSSWTPYSSLNNLDDNERKNIDNDNRSDDQSSCDDVVGGEARYSRCSLISLLDSISTSPELYSSKQKQKETLSNFAFSVVG